VALYRDCFPFPEGTLFSRPLFCLLETKKFNMSSIRKEYHVDDRSKKAATFFVACEPNQATRVKISDAMRAKGYSDVEATNRTMQNQVRREVEKIKGEAGPDPPALAAASSLLALATRCNNATEPCLFCLVSGPLPSKEIRKGRKDDNDIVSCFAGSL
jgi:hypothetical protein